MTIADLLKETAKRRKPAAFVEPTRETLAELQQRQRWRTSYHSGEKSLTLQVKAVCRRHASIGLRDDCNFVTLPDNEQLARVRADGGSLYDALCGKGTVNPFFAMQMAPFMDALALLRASRKEHEDALIASVKELELSRWCEAIPGVNVLSVAQMVAELLPLLLQAGSLTFSELEGKARKRFGVAVIDAEFVAERAEALAETYPDRWKGGVESACEAFEEAGCKRQRKTANKFLAQIFGYNAARRSILYVIGENMIKAGSRENAHYYGVYLRRKERELARDPDIKPIVAHRRAMRIMMNAVLRSFLKEWRRLYVNETAMKDAAD